MKPAVERDLERDIARSLKGALERALAPGSGLEDLRAARDAAQLLGLPGLDRLIAALAPHSARVWPAEIEPVVERLQRVGVRAETAGIAEFRAADADFGALAAEIVAMEWTSIPSRAGVIGAPVPTIGAAEMLTDLPLAPGESAAIARRVRLTVPVAAATRAALDWLAGREGARRPLTLRDDASVLEVECHLRDAAGVPPAHEVLSGVGGNLGPPVHPVTETRQGSWILRVPAFSARRAYVMLEQGPLRIAVPWHAVLKLQVVRRDQIAPFAARLGMDVLAPLAPLAARGGESPVLTVAHGMKRAWLVADRLVWRLPADPADPEPQMVRAGLSRAVMTDDGGVFGLAEPRMLLAATPLPPFPKVEAPVEAPKTPAPPRPPEPELLDERWVTPLPAPGDAPPASGQTPPAHDEAPRAHERAISEPEPALLARAEPPPVPEMPPADEQALTAAEIEPPTPAGTAADPTPARALPGAATRPERRVLIAEDSITARIFLARLFEQLGFEVVTVERAAELNAALARGPWNVVCVDVELPDARGAGFLRGVKDLIGDDAPLVALARDDQDVVAARMAGVWRTLRKPVEPGALRRLLSRLGLEERTSG